MKRWKYSNKIIVLKLVMFFVSFMPFTVIARVDWNFSNFPTSISYNGGNVTSDDIRSLDLQDRSDNQFSTYVQVRSKSTFAQYKRFGTRGAFTTCPNSVTTKNYMSAESLIALAQASSNMLSLASPLPDTYTGPGLEVNEQTYPFEITAMVTMCSPIDDLQRRIVIFYKNERGEIVVPPPNITPNNICSLNSQNLNLNYESTRLNVDGITQSTNLNVRCTEGTPQNYQLKLTGTNVTNGRLNFTNGVSVQVSLNGTPVQANGSGIQLNGLTTKSIPVRAVLTGTAATSGPSYASGVLILEAQ